MIRRKIVIADLDTSGIEREHSDASTMELADAINDIGLINPIDVIWQTGRYRVLNGFGRVLACRYLGKTKIEAKVWSSIKEFKSQEKKLS